MRMWLVAVAAVGGVVMHEMLPAHVRDALTFGLVFGIYCGVIWFMSE